MAKSNTTTAKKAPSKSLVYREISERSGVARKDVRAVFDELCGMVSRNMKKNSAQQFTVPGLCKIVVRKKPATPAGQRPNPFRPGEMMEVKAKPARNVVKIRPLKGLKDMV